MAVRIGINGFGRIGRYITRQLAGNQDLKVVAINARADNETLAHLLKYDSVHGIYSGHVQANENGILVDKEQIQVTKAQAGEWQWGELGADIVLETTGKFRDKSSGEQHLQCGAKKVLISAPGKGTDLTVVMGVNDHQIQKEHSIISNASCTTNCMAPPIQVIHDEFGVKQGNMSTVHSYTMNQRILDGSHKDLRRARAAAMSIIPTTTGAAKAVEEVIPGLQGKLSGMAIRVPTPNVSLVDLNLNVEKSTSESEINAALKQASQGQLKGILGYSEEPLVSVDYIGSQYGGVVDSLTTTVTNRDLVKLIVWYDNESGFAHQLLRLARKVSELL